MVDLLFDPLSSKMLTFARCLEWVVAGVRVVHAERAGFTPL
jgi:hypothetical protein